VNDQASKQDFIPDAQRVKVTLHFRICGVPVFERPSDNAARLFGAGGGIVQGGLQ
jgi:hypothetical protein